MDWNDVLGSQILEDVMPAPMEGLEKIGTDEPQAKETTKANTMLEFMKLGRP